MQFPWTAPKRKYISEILPPNLPQIIGLIPPWNSEWMVTKLYKNMMKTIFEKILFFLSVLFNNVVKSWDYTAMR
jgi:hypothetical protein